MRVKLLNIALLALAVMNLGIAEGEPDPNTGPGKHDKALETHDTTLIDDRKVPTAPTQKKTVKSPKKSAKKRL